MTPKKFKKKIEEIKGIIEMQGSSGNWDYDPYMHGLYNGMEMVLAAFEEREPGFREAPKNWLADLEVNSKEIGTTLNVRKTNTSEDFKSTFQESKFFD